MSGTTTSKKSRHGTFARETPTDAASSSCDAYRDVLRFFTALLRHVDLGHLRNLGLRECASPTSLPNTRATGATVCAVFPLEMRMRAFTQDPSFYRCKFPGADADASSVSPAARARRRQLGVAPERLQAAAHLWSIGGPGVVLVPGDQLSRAGVRLSPRYESSSSKRGCFCVHPLPL